MLAPARLASPASVVKPVTSQSTPALRMRSFEFLSERYSATSRRPERRARCSASDNAAAQASSNSPISVCDGIMSAEPSPTFPDAETNPDEPIISSLKRPLNGDARDQFVSTDLRKSARSINQTPSAQQSCK